MSKEKSPSYQRYPRDYLSDIKVQAMTLEEEGMYNRLMDYCWCETSLPNDPTILAALCKGQKPTSLVLSCFQQCGDQLVHHRMDIERSKQEEWRKKSAIGGKHSAHKPKKPKAKVSQQGGSTTVEGDRLKGGSTLQFASAVCSLQSSTSEPPSEAKETPKPKKRASLPADLRLQPMKVFIEAEYLRVRGVPMVTDSSDWTQFNSMLHKTNGHLDLSTLEEAWTAFLESPDQFHQKQGHPLRYWSGNINAFVGARTHQAAQGRFDLHEYNMEVGKRFVARGQNETEGEG